MPESISNAATEPSSKEAQKIHQLLKHAEGTPYDEERDAYIARAQKLASRYSIDMELILARAEGAEKERLERVNQPAKRVYEMGSKGDRGAGTYSALFMHIARPNDVRTWKTNSQVDAFGMSVDLDYVESLFALLLPQMIAEGEDFIDSGAWRDEKGVTRASARKSFAFGFMERVEMRLSAARDEAMREAQAADSGTALVVRDKRKKVNDLYNSNVKSHRYWHRQDRGNSRSARRAGNVSGSNASFTGSKGRVSR